MFRTAFSAAGRAHVIQPPHCRQMVCRCIHNKSFDFTIIQTYDGNVVDLFVDKATFAELKIITMEELKFV
jgi:hypothetical protein